MLLPQSKFQAMLVEGVQRFRIDVSLVSRVE
jgi:hypothetical protein